MTLSSTTNTSLITYDSEIEHAITRLRQMIVANDALHAVYPARWLAIMLLEGDSDLERQVAEVPGGLHVLTEAEQQADRIAQTLGEDVDTLIADRRYRFIAQVVKDAVARPEAHDYTRSDQIDRVITHPWLGVPIFLALMWFVFQMTANVSGIYVDWIDAVISGPVTRWAVALLEVLRLEGGGVESLVVDGVIAGTGGVLVFVPVLAFLYFFLAVLEDSGYMARAAFVMDRFMRVIGLHGKSFIPLIVGFGCSVPGIYATRTLEDRRDRILTGLLVPFMSCAARLPVYVLFGTAFFGANSGNLVFAMYLLGIVMAVLTGLLLRRTLFPGRDDLPFVMELPPYRPPSLKAIVRRVWERTAGFVSGVGTVIVAASLVVWVLLSIPSEDGQPPELDDSLFGGVSKTAAPVFAPAGFGAWEATGALMSGMIAKEVVISTMSQIYDMPEDADAAEPDASPTVFEDIRAILEGFGRATVDTIKATLSIVPGIDLVADGSVDEHSALQDVLRQRFTTLEAVAFSVFVLLYMPCVATLGAMRQEFGARWMWFSVFYTLVIAWLAAVVTYQGGQLLGLG
jgi:ferrous iron transport protein B